MKNIKIKGRLKKVLPGYDVEKLSLKRDKKLIIENILNNGGDEEVFWLLGKYQKKEISQVLKSPSKGFWNDKSLNFWLNIFDVRVSKQKYEKAIRRMFIKTN